MPFACISIQNGKLGRSAPILQSVPDQMVSVGSNRALALGRMGALVPRPNIPLISEFSHGTDASVSARILAICMAKTRIRISQQALGFLPAVNGGFDFATTVALAAAAKDGVQIDIVISSDTDMAGYNGHLGETVPHLGRVFALCLDNPELIPPRNDLDKWLHLKDDTARDVIPSLGNKVAITHGLTTGASLDMFNSKFTIAPIHHSLNFDYWIQPGGGKKLAGNHAKVYIIDDSHYYVGSDNMYVSGTPNGLQEYGFLIEGKEAVSALLSTYWDPLWTNSSPFALRANLKMF